MALVNKYLIKAVLLVSIGLSLTLNTLAAELQIAPVFTTGMVLQRGAPIVITGKGRPGSQITVSLGSQERGRFG